MKDIKNHIKTATDGKYPSHLIFNDKLKNGDRSIKIHGADRATHEKVAKHLNKVGYQAEVRSTKTLIPAAMNDFSRPRFGIVHRIKVKNKT
jgi:hypothetical protein